MYMNTHRRQGGFSLVEVFVALLVLSVGLIALAKLQVDLVRGSSDARTRTIALSLAEEKVEDLRTFARTDGTGTWSVTANPMAWSYVNGPAITTPANTSCSSACTGGRIPPQTAYSNTLEVAGVRFKRTWEVAARDFTGTGPITSRTKDVRVTVAWQNEMGVEQQVNVLANVVEIPPGNVALASEPVAERPAGPQVAYTPGEAPEVIHIPIDTGTGKRETTKPLPTLQARGYSHEVAFDVVNYHTDGSREVVDRREEFVTVNCRCELAGPGRGRTPARITFTGNLLRDKPGKIFALKPQTGVVLTTGSDGKSDQSDLCNICCRDHHDGPSETLADGTTDYNRYNPTDGSDHQHFLMPSATRAATGDAYDEACRLKRINGVFQVFQDWRLETLTVVPSGYLDDSALTSYSQYISYVQQFVQEHASASGSPPSKASVMTESRDFFVGVNDQTFTRALYVDYMPANLVAFIDARLAEVPPKPVLEFIPFYEINLTKLGDWDLAMSDGTTQIPANDGLNCPPSSDPASIPGPMCVTNEEIKSEDVDETTYSRGVVFAGAVPGERRVRATVNVGNTGVAGVPAISPANASLSDSVLATVAGIPGIGGTFAFCASVTKDVDKKKLVAEANITVEGASTTPVCTADDTSFVWRCEPITAGEVVTVRFRDSQPSKSPTFVATPSSQSVTSPNSAVVVTLCNS